MQSPLHSPSQLLFLFLFLRPMLGDPPPRGFDQSNRVGLLEKLRKEQPHLFVLIAHTKMPMLGRWRSSSCSESWRNWT